MVNDLIFNILMALIVAVIGIIAKELIPYIKEKKAAIERQIDRTKWGWAVEIVDAVVRAVEQTVLDVHGDDKKAFAKHQIYKIFKQANISLTDDQIDTLIEAAVQEMNSYILPELVAEGDTDD